MTDLPDATRTTGTMAPPAATATGDTPDTMGRRLLPPPDNRLVTPLLTDLYQITMAYAYWKTNRHEDAAVFELFFRKNPFGGEYTIFCGLDQILRHLQNFGFRKDDLDYLKTTPALQHCDAAFFDEYLANLDCSQVRVHAMRQGTVAFPRVPLLVVEGPLGIGQLLETTLLTLVNYPSLVATNAARMVIAARGASSESSESEASSGSLKSESSSRRGGRPPRCVEFGLRRAQGPDGGFSASKYCCLGGCDGTSNVLAGKLLGVPVSGTHAHAFVQAHSSLDQVKHMKLKRNKSEEEVLLLPLVLEHRSRMVEAGIAKATTNDGELAAFVAYAASFPHSLLCLIDTYDTLQSGVWNFCYCALALHDLGYRPIGIRLDSGDLSYLSLECRAIFTQMAARFSHSRDVWDQLEIVASNDISEEVLHSLNKQGHAVTVFGIGTHLVTCLNQPALGCVYKLVEIDGVARIKLSQDVEKVIVPGRKVPFRLYGQAGWPLLDVMIQAQEAQVSVEKDHDENAIITWGPPVVGRRILCRHAFMETKRAAVIPRRVERLHSLVFDAGKVLQEEPSLSDTRKYVADQLASMRPDHLRALNPAPYKVSVSDALFKFLHQLWQKETPVVELE